MSTIIQYDLCDENIASIINSRALVSSEPVKYASLQLAPDGKIYVARYPDGYLGVINQPNVMGPACNFVLNGFSLAPGVSQGGLPGFVTSFFDPIFTSDTTVWQGSVNNDWFKPCNWDKLKVPDTSQYVIIPGGTTFQPLVAFDTAYCRSITIHVQNSGHNTVDVTNGGFLLKRP